MSESFDSLVAQVIDLRHRLHRHPELSNRESGTRDLLESLLGAIDGVELQRLGKTSLLASVTGTGIKNAATKNAAKNTAENTGTGRTLLCRAELDALPIQEETGLPWTSENPGVMHACGHDAHMAALYAAILWYAAHRDFTGEIRFLFQEAEETEGGAVDLIDSPLFDGVDEAYAFHSINAPAGRLLIPPKRATNGVAVFRITVHGKSTHGSMPHLGIDPIRILADIIGQLAALPSNAIDPSHAASLTFGTLKAGDAANQIPDAAQATGTIRAQSHDDLQRLCEPAKTLTVTIAQAHGAHADFEYGAVDPVVNDESITRRLLAELSATLGPDAVQESGPANFSDDFGFFSDRFPGAYLLLGAGDKAQGMPYPNHSARYFVLDEAIEPAVRAWIALIGARLAA
ncbi:amidohydrolase [Bifidobacterium goeldii]|uniref:Amidohydrolase n=1 Tax=Bifidobacterium goeldii TaxID=2306975 RepID=A0A430FM81_9BIFI|nr:M20 family metallopeptidase [Bifidobacterium goeldii]RSX53848.1 amidohydrolase [Bifidobacterium goeldii]